MNPSAILATSIYTGLSALVRLARKRVDKKTRKYLESILTHWSEAKEEYRNNRKKTGKLRLDFSPIKNAEANLRRFFLKILWYSTRRFGNKEFKRVYSWEEGTVGSLNALLNYLGARLRDLAMTRFPFPEPEKFQLRKYSDGTKLAIQKKYAPKYMKDGAVETYWKAGYKGNRKYPTVLLAHPSLPGLDFVDMIRAHGVELVRQCFIHNVPRSDTHRYIRLLIHRLTPFLDYVYTEGKSGRNYFEPDADKELRTLVQEIRTLYSGRVGKKQSITRKLNIDIPEPTVDIIWNKVIELITETHGKEAKKRYSKILDQIDQGLIVDRDAEKLFEQILSITQKEGNDWHRLLLSDFHHPKSLKSVIFAGDKMLDTLSSVLIVGELPVSGLEGRGLIDLTVFIRRNIKGHVLWIPFMIIEIKSKTSFDFNLYAVQKDKKKDCPPALYSWKRILTQDEWDKIVESDPDERVLKQLEAYENVLLKESRELIPTEVRLPKKIWKGVIVLDSTRDYSKVFNGSHFLLNELTNDILADELDMNKSRTLVLDSSDNDENTPRVALMLLKGKSVTSFIEEQSAAISLPFENPFKERVSDDRLLTQYISIPSSTSFGNAAAWVSRNWHLLNHIEEESHPPDKKLQVYWLDLLGDYPTSQLVKRRFGLDILLKKKQITRERYQSLTSLLDYITFINIRDAMDSFLLGNTIDLEECMEALSKNEPSAGDRVVVVDGWDQLKEMVPRRSMEVLRDIENHLLSILPKQNVNVIWIDNGVSHTRMNKHYQRACVRPLRHDSPRRFHVDEIIYNVPTAPRIFGWQTPRKEDTRFIIQDTPTQVSPWTQTIHVPHLRGWARKFRGLSKEDGVIKDRDVSESDFEGEPMYGRSVTLTNVYSSFAPLKSITVQKLQEIGKTLIPSLSRRNESSMLEEQFSDVHWQRASVPIKNIDSPSLADRIIFDPSRPLPEPQRSKKKYVEFSQIKRGWYYDRLPIDSNDREFEVGSSRRPPMYRRTGLDEVDSLSIRKREIKRIRSAARFLMKNLHKNTNLFSCCRDIVRVCGDVSLDSSNEDLLLTALQEVQNIILRNATRYRTWSLVENVRRILGDILTADNRAVLQMAQEINPDILSMYGNNLFLALLTVIKIYSIKPTEGLVTDLWESMAEWQLYQMGFRPVDRIEGIAQSQYDFQFIFSKLKLRAEHLQKELQPHVPVEDVVYGQIIWTEMNEVQNAWIVLPHDDDPLLGLVSNVRVHGLKLGWQQCTTDQSTLMTSVRTMTDTPERSQIALTTINEINILWFIDEIEGEEQWTAPVVLEYATSKEDGRLLRWFKLSPVPEFLLLELEKIRPRRITKDNASTDALFFGAFREYQEIEEVKVSVYVDTDLECYRVKFSSGHTVDIDDTYELITLLKYPYLKGMSFRTEDGCLLYWDNKKDIEYSDVSTRHDGKIHVMHLSFLKPLVHRAIFFSINDLLPKTCGDLLKITEGGTVTLVVEVDELRRNKGEFNFIKTKLRGLPKKSQLKNLEEELMNPYDVELLLESRELIDISVGKNFTLESDVSQLKGIRLPSGITEDSQLASSLYQSEAWDGEQEFEQPEGDYHDDYDYEEGLNDE